MREVSLAQLFGGAVLAILATGGTSMARPAAPEVSPHVMTVQLPDGGVAQITYFGNVAPQIVVAPPEAMPAHVVLMPPGFAAVDPFAALERISAEMDAQAAFMMRRAVALAAQPMPGPMLLTEAANEDPREGASRTTYIATFNGDGVCMRSTEIIGAGLGGRPRVISQVSGACGSETPMTRASAPVRDYLPSVPAESAPTIRVRAVSRHQGAAPYAGMVHPAVMFSPAD